MSFQALLTEDRRLAVLRVLTQAPRHRANGSVLQTALGAIGHDVSRDTVRADLAWLAEQGLIEVSAVSDSLHVAELTQRGADVAAGRSVVPGVKRPAPGGA